MSAKAISNDSLKNARVAGSRPVGLPITRDLTPAYVLSSAIVLVMAATAAASLLFRTTVYPTDALILSYLPVDVFHLVLGLPILLGSMWLARRGKLAGLLCWPGALLYVLYSYITNLAGVPFGVLFLPYLSLVVLSAYTTIGLVTSIDGEVVRQRLTGAVPAKLGGGVLAGVTTLFLVINVTNVVAALRGQAPAGDMIPVWIADFTVVIPTSLAGGILLWRRRALGYVAAAGLLLQYDLLFAGLIPVMAFPAFYTAAPVDVTGILFILVMAVICFVPLAFFGRGIGKSSLNF
jgi:hypothetical protein